MVCIIISTKTDYALIFRRIKAKTRVLIETGALLANTVAAQRCGKNIARLLRYQNRSQVWLADKLRVAESTVSNWLSGRNSPSDAMKDEIAEVFGVDVEELYLKFEDEVGPAPTYADFSKAALVDDIAKSVLDTMQRELSKRFKNKQPKKKMK